MRAVTDDAGLLWVESSKIPEGHVITYYYDKDKLFVMDNGLTSPAGIIGPFKSLNEIPYDIRGFL